MLGFLPRSSGGSNSELVTVYLADTDRPSQTPGIVARHDVCDQECGGNMNTWYSAAENLPTQQVSSY